MNYFIYFKKFKEEKKSTLKLIVCLVNRAALRLGHIGHRRGSPTRKRLPNFETKINIFFGNIGKKIVYIFSLLLRSFKELSDIKDNTTLYT